MNNILGIEEKDNEGNHSTLYAVPDACPITKVNLETKIQFEIEQWIHVLTAPGAVSTLNNRSRLADFSQALDTLHKEGNKTSIIAIARTVRMLIMLEAVMCPNITDVFQHSDNKREIVKSLQKKMINNYAKISILAGKISNTYILINEDKKIRISLALIIVLSTALSQCEYQCPTLWEAYSAGRARNELKRKWEYCDLEPITINSLITIICCFIRYQSAFGQYSRGTGTGDFLNKIGDIMSELKKGGLVISSDAKRISTTRELTKIFKDALKIFGIIQEARNKPIFFVFPHNGKEEVNEYYINEIDVHLGVKYKIDKGLEQLKKSINMILRANNSRRWKGRFTWAFAGWLKEELGDDKETVFKEMMESYISNKYTEDKDISAISFGRSQLLDIKDYLIKCAETIPVKRSYNKFNEYLEGRFNTNLLKVPHWYIAGGEEKVVELQLKDEIQGLALLNFPLKDINKIVIEGRVKTIDSGELFIFLFDNVIKKYNQFDMKEGKDNYGIVKYQNVYMPMPIMKRILDVVYRFRPTACIPIYFSFRIDGSVIGRQEIVYIPQDIKKPDSYKPVFKKKIEIYSKCILKYVYGYVLNTAMTSGFRNCDISWHNVESAVKNNKSQKVGWIEMSKKIYDEDNFDALLGDYLMKYNTEREAVEKRAITESTLIEEVIEEVKIEDIPSLFGKFLESKNIKNKKYLLGIDIGGTLIKFCLYEDRGGESKINIFKFDSGRKTFRFRILTKPPGEKENSKQFTKRIVRAIKNNAISSNIKNKIIENISAVGITWPGAVREDRIYGFSGILKKFQGFEKKPKDMPVQAYWEFKVVEDFEEAWKKEFQTKSVPTVTLLNDGDAEATGALYQRSLNGEENDQKNGKDVAVLKLGTGTAGAYFKDGRQTSGLKEWGKVLLDTGRTDFEFYPAGVANLYLSQRTMPRLGKDRYRMFKRGAEAESSEMGKALEIVTKENKGQKEVAGIGGNNRKKVKELLKETGLKQFASSKDMEGIEVEALREVLDKGRNASTAVFDEIQLRVGELGDDVQGKLEKEIIPFYGTHRLSQLLDCDAQDIKSLKSINETGKVKLGDNAHRPFIYFIDSSEKAAETMGIYLGDFIVLLYDHYGVSDFIIGGGVLNDRTGDIAMGKAIERIKYYFNSSEDDPENNETKCKIEWVQRFEKKCINIERQSKIRDGGDYATLGAALYAAGQTLKWERELGIAEIKRRVSELQPTNSVVLKNDSIKFGEDSELIMIAEYALTFNDVKNYLLHNGPAIGLYYSSEEGEGTEINMIVKYIRWIIR
ncbi:hypothetical protein ACFL5S_00440 [Fibrobacterota bacterium]